MENYYNLYKNSKTSMLHKKEITGMNPWASPGPKFRPKERGIKPSDKRRDCSTKHFPKREMQVSRINLHRTLSIQISLLLCCISFLSLAQVTPQWISRYNGLGATVDQGIATTTDPSGNIYVAGTFRINSEQDILIVKYDSNGVKLWENSYSGTAVNSADNPSAIALDDSGNVFLTGYVVNSSNNRDIVVLKYNPNGNLVWSQEYDVANGTDNSNALALDDSGNVYITGQFYNGVNTGYDCITIKYTSTGSLAWANTFAGQGINGSEAGNAITLDNFGNIYVAGQTYSTTSGINFLVLKYNRGGSTIWDRRYSLVDTTKDTDIAYDIVVDDLGDIYVAGMGYSTITKADYMILKYDSAGNLIRKITYDGGQNVTDEAKFLVLKDNYLYVSGNSTLAATGKDMLTIKYDTSGVYQWEARYFITSAVKSDLVKGLALDAAGNIYVGGDGEGASNYNYIVVKYDPAGAEKWARVFNGKGNGTDNCYSMAVTPNGNVYLTGGVDIGTDRDMGTIKYNAAGVKKWEMYYAGPGNGPDEGSALAVDAQGNVYVTGKSMRGLNPNMAIVKYDPYGNQIWESSYDGPGDNSYDDPKGIAVDNAGNVYITGTSTNKKRNSDIATIKYSPLGQLLWAKRYNGDSLKNDEAAGIAVHPATGDVYVTGYTTVTDTNYNFVTIKYNTNGAIKWTKTYDNPIKGSYDYASALALDATNSSVYVSGSCLTNNLYDITTIKYNASTGSEVWIKEYDGNDHLADNCKGIALDASGNIYVIGRSRIGPNYDFITIKYDNAGTQKWIAPYNNGGYEDPKGIAIHDASGSIYVTGTSSGNGTLYDIATVKYDANGVQKWAKRYNGPGNLDDDAGGIIVDDFGNPCIIGQLTKTSTDLDYITVSYASINGEKLWEHTYNASASQADMGRAITIDDNGIIYVTGASYDTLTKSDFATIKFCIASGGRDTTICLGKSASLQATGGTGFSWSPSDGLSCTSCANPIATPTISTSYVVTVTNASCSGTDTVVVDVLPLPTPDVSQNVLICPGSNTQLTASGGNTYRWSPATGLSNTNISNPIAFPTSTTIYTLTLTNANGCTATSAVTVSVSPVPPTDAGPPQTICSGDSAQLNGSGGDAYIWNPSSDVDNPTIANPKASPFFNTTYTLTAIDGNSGCNSTDTVTVFVIPAPLSFAGQDTNICPGASATLNGLAPGADTYSWSPPTGLSCTSCTTTVATPATTTTYTFAVSNGFCTDTDEVVIIVDTIPLVYAGPDDTICGAGNSISMVAIGGSNYTWSPAGGLSCTDCPNPTATLNATTTFTVTASTTSNCSNTDQVTILVVALPTPSISQNGAVITCNPAFASYQWYLGSTTLPISGETGQSYNVQQNNTYIVIVTDANGCTGLATYNFLSYAIDEKAGLNVNMRVFPNPNGGNFILDFTTEVADDYTLSLKNTLGEEIFSETLTQFSGNYHRNFNMDQKAKGIYMLYISNQKNYQIQKISIY